MRVSDFIATRLKHLGCSDVYMVTGGAAMHLNDSFGRVFRDKVHFLHHEQSCSIAAESYSRLLGKPAIVNVTAGPGSINALNGVFGAYVDSIPMIIISGQSKRETLVKNSGIPKLRQLGDQEVDIISMVNKICKESILLEDPEKISTELDKCYISATTNRPGPIWIDVPIDVQGYNLPNKFNSLVGAQLNQKKKRNGILKDNDLTLLAKKIIESKKPVLYVGNGIRISGAYEQFIEFLKEWPIATVTGWNSNDILWDDHLSYCGRPGSVGNRAGNFAVQLSDCVITVGSRLNIRQVSYNYNSFAKNAWKCHIDIDKNELEKPTLNTDLKINSCIKDFFPKLNEKLNELKINTSINKSKSFNNKWREWRKYNKNLLERYPGIEPCKKNKRNNVNPYLFINKLFEQLKEDQIIICGDGTACVVSFQAARIKKGQRLYHNSGCASMGYEIPASIGAYHAKQREIICIAGDGSIMMNLQELTIIGEQQLPIKIFLLNNKGYHSIRQTQNNYFPSNTVGCGIESGLPFPSFKKVTEAFNIKYNKTMNEEKLESDIKETLSTEGSILHEIVLNLNQDFEPKLTSKRNSDGSMSTPELEDMSPFLEQGTINEIINQSQRIE